MNSFQSEKTSVQVNAVPKLTVSLQFKINIVGYVGQWAKILNDEGLSLCETFSMERESNGRSNPEVVGSIPTMKVKRIFSLPRVVP